MNFHEKSLIFEAQAFRRYSQDLEEMDDEMTEKEIQDRREAAIEAADLHRKEKRERDEDY